MTRSTLTRRGVLAGAAGLVALPALPRPAHASQAASRVFSIWRDGSDIGRHRLDARLTEQGFEIDIQIDIAVKFLGITAYRYELENREVWAGQRIVSVDSRGNDDGDRTRCRIARAGGALEIDGSGYSGSEPLDAVTTSYYAPAFLDRRPWISTQSGKPLSISVSRRDQGKWAVSGDVTTVLTYRDGEWTGSAFTTKGERITYQTLESSGEIAALWQRA